MTKARLLFYPALLLVLSAQALAQISTASLAGVVQDPSQGVVPNIEIKLTHVDTGRAFQATTDSGGRYTFSALPVGRYKIIAGAAGFKTVEREFELSVSQAANLNLTMDVGKVTEVVNVQDTAPLVNATNATVGTVIDTKQVFDLPLAGRNFLQLVSLTPGVSTVDPSQGGAGPSIQGQRNRDNLYLTDGVINSNLTQSQVSISPPLDSILEFRVESVNNDAEFGGAAGGYINLATRSGTNQYHGTAYDYLRNDVLNSRNMFQTTIPKFRNNQYGGSVGGPVLIPKLYNGKNKTWFFLAYEGVKNRATASTVTRVPTAAELSGDFSVIVPGVAASNIAIYNPFTTRADPARAGQFLRDPFPNRVIPASLFNPISAKYLSTFAPTPNYSLAGSLNNFIVTGASKSDSGIWVGRADHSFSEKDRVSFRVTNSESNGSSVGVSQTISSNVGLGRNMAAEWNHSITPAMLLNVRWGYNRNLTGNSYTMLDQVWSFIKFANVQNPDAFPPFDPRVPLFPGYGITGYANMSGAVGYSPSDSISNQGAINVQRFAGRHNFKAGITMLNYTWYGGGISMTENFGVQPTQNLQTPAGTGQGLATFMLGLPTDISRPLGLPVSDVSGWLYGVYLADTFKITRKLSINYGVRWDFNTTLKSASKNLGSFDRWTRTWLLEGPINIPGALFQGPNVRRGFIDPDWNNFSPRLGAAYALTSKDVFRGGYSMFYDMYAGWQQIAQGPRVSWPNSTFQAISGLNPNIPSVNIDRPFVGLASTVNTPNPFPAAGYHINRFFKTPFVHQFNVALEHQFNDKLSASATYVGAIGRKLECCGLTNYATVLGPGAARAPEKVPYPEMLVFRTNDNNGTSDYHSLQLKAEQRFQRGLSLLFSYTWSKSLDLACSGYIGAEGCNMQQPYNVQADRGPSTFDLTHIANVSFVYELPIGKGKKVNISNYALNLLAGGWQASGILSWRSGQALTPILSIDNANNGGSTQRPDVIGDTGQAQQDRLHWFNIAAFAYPAKYTYGNSGRSILRGPAAATQSLSLFKNLQLKGDSLKVQYRADLLNAFNHPLLNNPGTTFDTAAFGQINSAGGNRTIQMAIKVIF
jgi:hypothetical protein